MATSDCGEDLALAHPYEEAPRKMLWETMEGRLEHCKLKNITTCHPIYPILCVFLNEASTSFNMMNNNIFHP